MIWAGKYEQDSGIPASFEIKFRDSALGQRAGRISTKSDLSSGKEIMMLFSLVECQCKTPDNLSCLRCL